MRENRKSYPSDITDTQWDAIEHLFEDMRNRKWDKRELLNAVFYKVDSGCKWRSLPHDLPPWKTVYSFFRRAVESGLWDEILECLVGMARQIEGREVEPAYAIIDSQSVKTVGASQGRGVDGGKKN